MSNQKEFYLKENVIFVKDYVIVFVLKTSTIMVLINNR